MYMTCALEAASEYEYIFARKAAYCIRIQLVRSKRLVRTSTSLRLKSLIAYVYDLCAWSNLCVLVRLCAQSGLFCTYTTCALKTAYAYEYVFVCKSVFPSTPWWLVDVAITVVLDAIWFVRSCYDCRDWWYLILPTLQLLPWCMLSDFSERCDDSRDCENVLIGLPGGYIWRMRSSGVFSPTIWRSDWTVFVVWSSGFRQYLLLTYFCDWVSDSYLWSSLWWWAILNPPE